MTATEARHLGASADHAAGYLLLDVKLPTKISERPSLSLNGEPVIITPHDTSWLAKDQAFVVSDVTFEQLSGGLAFRKFASTAEMISGLYNPSLSFGANIRVTIHARIVQPILDVTLLFLGLPLVLSRRQRNIFVAIGWGIAVVGGFKMAVLLSHELGKQVLISPVLAAWLPVFVFVPIAVASAEPILEMRGGSERGRLTLEHPRPKGLRKIGVEKRSVAAGS
jgi:lipopolysaccharide export system permease protein